MSQQKTILLVTDFSYEAKGREYFREDVELSVLLRRKFRVCVTHIADIDAALPFADVVLLRNTGPQTSHRNELLSLRHRQDLCLFNDLKGKGDINGKRHLLELFKASYPVIPTFGSKKELDAFGEYERYLIKPIDGADSAGVKVLNRAEACHEVDGVIFQPLIDLEHEVSFFFINQHFQYALVAPNQNHRWELQNYVPTKEEIDFASRFIAWNTCEFGIQRVDACRLKNGELLLMELEDYNPFLSLDRLSPELKERFAVALCATLEELASRFRRRGRAKGSELTG